MKIGLLTYHHSVNNGAMLQTYATVKALKQLGHDVLIVDVRQPEKKHSSLIGGVVNLLYFKRNKDIQNFRNSFYPTLTRRYFSVDELRNDPPQVDCLVVGSDQTWNPDISKEMALAYFLDFGDEQLRRFSYAASFGISRWPDNSTITSNVHNALNRFSCISVRIHTCCRSHHVVRFVF